jgi:hypothetical protein
MSLLSPVQAPGPGPLQRSTLQSGAQALLREALTHALHGGAAHLHGFGDGAVRPRWPLRTAVRLEQDSTMSQGSGCRLALLSHRLQQLPLLGSQGYYISSLYGALLRPRAGAHLSIGPCPVFLQYLCDVPLARATPY